MGLHGAKEVKEHKWFKNYNWKDLYHKRLDSPFIPNGEDNFDFKYCNAVINPGVNTKERYEEILNSESYKTKFLDYFDFNRFSINIFRINYNSPINLMMINSFRNKKIYNIDNNKK